MKLELGGNINLQGFRLDSQELVIAKKLIGKYAKRIRNYAEYSEIRIELKTRKKNVKREYEAKVLVDVNGQIFTSEGRELNLFSLIDGVLKKVLHEIKHKKSRENPPQGK